MDNVLSLQLLHKRKPQLEMHSRDVQGLDTGNSRAVSCSDPGGSCLRCQCYLTQGNWLGARIASFILVPAHLDALQNLVEYVDVQG